MRERAKLLRRVAAQERETTYQGIPVVVEYAKGETRTGTNKQGDKWSRKMEAHYGYIPDTRAKGDAENLDIYIGDNADSPTAYVIDQLDDKGEYDEPKCILGCDSEEEAKALYLKHYPPDQVDRIGDVWPISIKRLAEMVSCEQEAHEQRIFDEMEEKEAQGKQAFLSLEELRERGRRELNGPRFRKFIDVYAPGKSWDDLDDKTQRRVLIIEQNDALGIDDDPMVLVPDGV
jgi:hypothetical protein